MNKKLIPISMFFIILLNFNFIYSSKIYVNSIQKCGTHLLTKCIELLTQKKAINESNMLKKRLPILTEETLPILSDNEFFHCHKSYSSVIENNLVNANFKILFIYRDPRDQIVSLSHWIIKKSKKHPLCNFKENCPLTINQITEILIKRINRIYSRFLPWLNSKSVCSVKFENLIGPNGGGSLQLQKREIRKICNHIGIKCNQREDYCLKNLFGGTATFRKGGIGSWKNHFTKEQKDLFKKIGGDLLINLGYEKNFNW